MAQDRPPPDPDPPDVAPPEPEFQPAHGEENVVQDKPRLVRAKIDTTNPEKLRPFLAWLPLRVVKATLEHTTQLAKTMASFPMTRHVQSRFAWLNRFRLDEKVSTDVIFANRNAIGGHSCAQIYYRISSHVINVHGMKSESGFANSYSDFLREEGIPSVLRRDYSTTQRSQTVQDLQRKYMIRDEFSEPHHQQQNPVERNAIRWLK